MSLGVSPAVPADAPERLRYCTRILTHSLSTDAIDKLKEEIDADKRVAEAHHSEIAAFVLSLDHRTLS